MKDSQRVLRHVAIFRRKVDYKDGKIQKFNYSKNESKNPSAWRKQEI